MIQNSYLCFGVNGVILVAFFFGVMWLFGFNTYEKNLLLGTVKKVIRKENDKENGRKGMQNLILSTPSYPFELQESGFRRSEIKAPVKRFQKNFLFKST